MVRESLNKEGVEEKMNMFTLLSLLHYFSRDRDQILSLWNPAVDLVSSERCIVQAATQVMHWIAMENPECAVIFREPVKNAFLWIQDRKFDKYWFSGLLVLKRGKRFPKSDIAHNTLHNFQSIFQIVCSEDYDLRMLAVTILDFQFRYISVHANTNLITAAFDDCLKYVMKHNTITCHGPLCFLQTLFDIRSSMFNVDEIFIDTLIARAANSYQPFAIEAYKFLFDITRVIKRAFTKSQVEKIVKQLLARCPEPDDPHPYFEYLGKFIRVFKLTIDIAPIFEFCKKQIDSKVSMEQCKYSFCLLAIMLEVCPEKIQDFSVFSHVYACDEYVRCIHRLSPNVPVETLTSIRKYIEDSLVPSNPGATFLLKASMASAMPAGRQIQNSRQNS